MNLRVYKGSRMVGKGWNWSVTLLRRPWFQLEKIMSFFDFETTFEALFTPVLFTQAQINTTTPISTGVIRANKVGSWLNTFTPFPFLPPISESVKFFAFFQKFKGPFIGTYAIYLHTGVCVYKRGAPMAMLIRINSIMTGENRARFWIKAILLKMVQTYMSLSSV